VGVIYHKNENFRASGSIRYKCWHSNHFRKKNIFNILFCVQTGFSHSLSVQVAITEYWRMGGLKNKHLFLTVLKARKFKTRAPTELMSGKSPPPGSHTAIFLLYPYMIERRERAHTYMWAEGEANGEGEADAPLSGEPDAGLDPGTPGSWPELKAVA